MTSPWPQLFIALFIAVVAAAAVVVVVVVAVGLLL